MATPAVEKTALSALSQALADPTPKPLFGTKAKPGFFIGASQKNKDAAKILTEHRWLEPTGDFEGKGKSRKELHRLMPAGIEHALASGDQAELLRGILGALDQNRDRLEGLRREIGELTSHIQQSDTLLQTQRTIVEKLLGKVVPPNLSQIIEQALQCRQKSAAATASPDTPAADWQHQALEFVKDYQRRNPYSFCPLPELSRGLSKSMPISIGTFHDGLRELVQQRKLRLHPFTGSHSELVDEQYALLAAKEIKYYAEFIG